MTTVPSRTLEPFCGNTFKRKLEPHVFTRNYAFSKANEVNQKRFEVANEVALQINKSCNQEIELYDLYLNSNNANNFFDHEDNYQRYRSGKRESRLFLLYLPIFAASAFFYFTKKIDFRSTVKSYGFPLILSGIGISMFSAVLKEREPKFDNEEILYTAFKILNIASISKKLN